MVTHLGKKKSARVLQKAVLVGWQFIRKKHFAHSTTDVFWDRVRNVGFTLLYKVNKVIVVCFVTEFSNMISFRSLKLGVGLLSITTLSHDWVVDCYFYEVMQNRECIVFGWTRDTQQGIYEPCSCLWVSCSSRLQPIVGWIHLQHTCTALEFARWIFFIVTAIHDISKQIKQCTCIQGRI